MSLSLSLRPEDWRTPSFLHSFALLAPQLTTLLLESPRGGDTGIAFDALLPTMSNLRHLFIDTSYHHLRRLVPQIERPLDSLHLSSHYITTDYLEVLFSSRTPLVAMSSLRRLTIPPPDLRSDGNMNINAGAHRRISSWCKKRRTELVITTGGDGPLEDWQP
jgi:hypothetical protein